MESNNNFSLAWGRLSRSRSSIAQLIQRKSALIAGVLAGLASPGSICVAADYPRRKGSDLERMRGDMTRVGRDFSTVINRENGHKTAAGKANPRR